MPFERWENCYDDSWKGVIVDEAFAHPAKVARGLARRIYAHLFARGWLQPGDCVVDPFGGIAGTALDAMLCGCHWFGCELEAKANGGSPFVELGNENIAKWAALGMPGTAVLVQGDSRKLCDNLCGVMASVVCSSPPYFDGTQVESRIKYNGTGTGTAGGKSAHLISEGYGTSPGQLGSMKSGSVEDAIAVVVGSPPYSEAIQNGQSGIDWSKRKAGATTSDSKLARTQDNIAEGYGTSDGQLSAMPTGSVDAVVSSPPYAQAITGDHRETETAAETRDKRQTEGGAMGRSCRHGGYGATDGNLSAMQAGEVADCLVSSPPYEGSAGTPSVGRIAGEVGWNCGGDIAARGRQCTAGDGSYGETNGQLGHTTGDTFWSASRTIIEQCHAILRPGGVACWIVKAFVRKGEIVDFPGDWQRLCEACGFKTVEVVHASLVKETRTPDLFGGEVVKRKERKSFFRRLAEKKGSPEINEEVVLLMRKRVTDTSDSEIRDCGCRVMKGWRCPVHDAP